MVEGLRLTLRWGIRWKLWMNRDSSEGLSVGRGELRVDWGLAKW